MLLTGLLTAGCASRRGPTGTTVRKVRFEGNPGLFSPLGNASLRAVMEHPQPSFDPWPVRKRVGLREDTLATDLERVQTVLAHHGYFDATVGWRIDTRKPANERRGRVVDVVGEVSLGEQSVVETVSLEGVGSLPRRLRRRLRAEVRSARDEPFTLAAHEMHKGGLVNILRERGYPSPSVVGDAAVRRDEHAVELTYTVESGPRAVFGETRIRGLERVPEPAVRRSFAHREGRRFDQRALQRTRTHLYGMDVFSLVGVQPASVEDGTVPVTVSVEEAAPRSVSVRTGLGLQNGRQEALVGSTFSHANAFSRLLRLNADAEFGLAALAEGFGRIGGDAEEVLWGFVGEASVETSASDVGGSRLDPSLRLQYERQLTEAFTTDQPSITASVAWRYRRDLTLSLAYRFDFTRYAEIRVDPAEIGRIDVAPDLVDGRFVNARVVPRVVWDRRNDVLAPTRGTFVDAQLDLAGAWLGGNYNYAAVRLDLRGYQGIGRVSRRLRRALRLQREQLVIAARLSGGIIAPYGPPQRRVVPVAERLYLGGASSARGWRYRALGPYVCDDDEAQECRAEFGVNPGDDVDTVPVGGRVSTLGTLELRQTWDAIRVVVFSDVGMVWSRLEDLQRLLPQPSVGAGVRLVTPIGPLRFDVAYRLTDPPVFGPEPRAWFHLGLGEAF